MLRKTLQFIFSTIFTCSIAHPVLAQMSFRDATSGLPLADAGEGVGVVWGDYDKDGDLDLYLVNHDGANRLFQNIDGERFIDAGAVDSKLAPLENTSAGNGAAWADINGDGDLDLYLSNKDVANLLIERQGGGVYSDITSSPLNNTGNGMTVAWTDYNNDGLPDIFLPNRNSANKLFKNTFNGVSISFEDAGETNLEDTGDSYAGIWGDYDNDGDLDLYVVNNNSANKLFRNEGGTSFTSISGVIEDTGPGRAAAWGDYDNDGDLDLYLSQHGAANKLFENVGNDEFEDVTTGALGDTGNGRSVAWGDFDNDGNLDLYLVNNGSANKMFRSSGNGSFVEDTPTPLNDTGAGSGMAFADYDDDGDLDIYQADFGGANKLFENTLSNNNNWVKVKLSRGASALGVGARITVKTANGDLIREISGGSGFLSQNSQIAHFGLGDIDDVDIEVEWPSGLNQAQQMVDVNQTVEFVEVEDEELPRPPVVRLDVVPGTPYLTVSWDAPNIPDSPTITAPTVTEDGSCELDDGTPATNMKIMMNYVDPDGDVTAASGVTVYGELTSLGEIGGVIDGSIITGDDPANGEFGCNVCMFFGDESFLEVAMTIIDAAGHSSNFLTMEIVNPLYANGNLIASSSVGMRRGMVSRAGATTSAKPISNQRQDLELIGYRIDRFDQDRQVAEDVATVAPFITEYVDEQTTPNTNYTYSVTALYSSGQSAPENQDDFALDVSDGEIFRRVLEGDLFEKLSLSAGCSWGDIDNDGDLDIFIANDALRVNFLFENNGDGTFTEITTGPVVEEPSYSHGGSFADFDNDGDLDLFVANWRARSFLYSNNGDGTFTKLTGDADYPMLEENIFSNSGAWGDYNNDGHLDLFVAKGFNLLNSLYLNDGDATFTEVTNFLVDDQGNVLFDGGRSTGAFWADYSRDGFLDLYVTNREDDNYLYRNNRDGTFTKVVDGAIANDGGNSNGASWGDFNNDGWLDLFVTNEKNVAKERNNYLYQSMGASGDGKVEFQRIAASQLVDDEDDSWGSGWADFDNDGDLDIIVTNQGAPNFLYRNDGATDFFKIEEGNIGNNGGDSRGAGWSDYTNDGFVDILLSNLDSDIQNPHNLLYENLRASANRWLKVRAIGTNSNRSAVGAQVSVKANINGVDTWQTREISTYTGWGSQNSLELTLGVGDATMVDSVRIAWPSGVMQEMATIQADTTLILTEPIVNRGPTAFSRLEPADDAVIMRENVVFKWSKSIDPDGDEIRYALNIQVGAVNTTFSGLVDTSFTIDLSGFGLSTDQHTVTWALTATDVDENATSPENGSGQFFLEPLVSVAEDDAFIPTEFRVFPNFPNPFNASTLIRYHLPEKSQVELTIYSAVGKHVRSLVLNTQPAGVHQVHWHGLDDLGNPVSTGVYTYRLKTTAGDRSVGKMILLR